MINVAYSCDEKYIEQTVVSIKSLFENASFPNRIHIFFISLGVSDSSKKKLYEIVNQYGSLITIIDFSDLAFDLNASNNTGRHVKSVYVKLFFGRIKDIERIIYLDSDVVVCGAIEDLWNIDLDGKVCAGVETVHTIKQNEQIGYSVSDRAINDGVVLIDLKKWRNSKYLERCLDYIASYNGNPPVLSEGTINAICKGDIAIIHPRFNLMSGLIDAKAKDICSYTERPYYSQKELDEANSNPLIIHYLAGFYNRPWCKQCSHPHKDIYLKYRNMTDFRFLPLSNTKLSLRLRVIGFLNKVLPVSVFKMLKNRKTIFK